MKTIWVFDMLVPAENEDPVSLHHEARPKQRHHRGHHAKRGLRIGGSISGSIHRTGFSCHRDQSGAPRHTR
jgi:hypothetical protein